LKNILLITFDELRKDALGCYGNELIQTPNVDALAAAGMRFENFFVQAPQCMSSRASILTGMYPSRCGVPRYGISLRADFPNLAAALSGRYHTAIIGKTHFYYEGEDPYREPAYGFEVNINGEAYKAYAKTAASPRQMEALLYNKRKRDPTEPHENPLPEAATRDYWTAEQSARFLETYREGKPFFLWTSFVNPHFPLNPPKRFCGLYRPEDVARPFISVQDETSWQRSFASAHWRWFQEFSRFAAQDYKKIYTYYYGMITMVDEYVGKIIRCLKKQNLFENTLVMITADHGDMMGDHGLPFKGQSHYDQQMNVPFIVCGPGAAKSGASGSFVEGIDIAPTILDYAGLAGSAAQKGMDGISIRPVLEGRTETAKDAAFMENLDTVKIFSIRTADYSLSAYPEVGEGELYRMRDDPEQIHNLWRNPEYQTVKDSLIKRLFLMRDWEEARYA
jgi:arylsulfatase A-like enzyme